MKTIYNWILIGFFAFLIFSLEKTNIAVFILMLLWLGSNYTLEKHRKFIHVFQVLNDFRFQVLSEKVGLTKEEGATKINKLENENLSKEELKRLHEDMDGLGLK
jgi:hypothetical protein